MPRPPPVVLFALGAALGALGWILVTAAPQAKPRRSTPAPSVSAMPEAARPDSTASASSEHAASADARAVAADASAPALHLWEALALRGAPVGDETKWFPVPDMTGKGGYATGSPDEPLNPAFAAFFNLTPEESGRVQALLQSTLRLQHEMDVARIERIESKFRIKTAIGIPDYSAQGAVLKQTFDGGLHAILGDARHRVYQDWGAKTFRDDFPGLAGVRREYHIIPARDDEPPGSFQVVTVKLAPGEEWKGMHFTSYHPTLEDAVARTQLPLARYLPAPDATTPTVPAPTAKPAQP